MPETSVSPISTVLVDGLGFAEGLRWHAGELWFSDFESRRVASVTPGGTVTVRGHVRGQPSGIGFLPDGTPLVVSMFDQLVVRLGEHLTLHGDGSAECVGPMNDMVVDPRGRTYFGSFGSSSYEKGEGLSRIGLITEDGAVSAVADGLSFPNGMAVTADGGTLMVAETFGKRLTAFPIHDDGTLGPRQVFADLGHRGPDGICLDSTGAVWVGCPIEEEFVRVADGGEVLEVIPTPGRWAVTCALGGDDGRTLFCATAETTIPQFHRGEATATISTVRVDIPGPPADR